MKIASTIIVAIIIIVAAKGCHADTEKLPDAEFTITWQERGTASWLSPSMFTKNTVESRYTSYGSALIPGLNYAFYKSSGLKREQYPIQIEFGVDGKAYNVPKLEQQYGLAKLYTDFWLPWANDNTLLGLRLGRHIVPDRSEIHLSRLFSKGSPLEVSEGDTVWIGYSQFFTHLDHGCKTTNFQFHHTRGTGPATGIILLPHEDQLFFAVQQRKGPAKPVIDSKGRITEQWQRIKSTPEHTSIKADTGKWYGMVMEMKYSRNDDGLFRLWIYDHTEGSDFSLNDKPTYERKGNTMYSTSTNGQDKFEIRMGQYRWCRKPPNTPTTSNNRYTNMYLGPIRVHRGEGKDGFYRVHPFKNIGNASTIKP